MLILDCRIFIDSIVSQPFYKMRIHALSILVLSIFFLTGCQPSVPTVAETPTTARTLDRQYISWNEHIIDDEQTGGVPIRGGDGLKMADFDGDGHLDIVSVHEDSDHIRIAYGTGEPDRWHLFTLAEGQEVRGAEDIDVGDLNSDGHLDLIIACEGGHFLYLENPGTNVRKVPWKGIIPDIAAARGSFIRIYFADLDGDGKLEVLAVNKGTDPADEGVPSERPKTAISWFEVTGDPLDSSAWKEHTLTKVKVPINAKPVDIDGDGDIDIVSGSRGESRIFWFENLGGEVPRFRYHEIRTDIRSTSITSGKAHITGFSLFFLDFSGDGRLDILSAEIPYGRDRARFSEEWTHPALSVYWLEQPQEADGLWRGHRIGAIAPDIPAGLVIADINGDGYEDVMVGGYSRGPRLQDGDGMTAADPLGRLTWFENPGELSIPWKRHDISRRKRGMFDEFIPLDMDQDGDLDFVGTRGNSGEFDGVFWLEQVQTTDPVRAFRPARASESRPMPLMEK